MMRSRLLVPGLIALLSAAPLVAQTKINIFESVTQPQPVDSATQADELPIQSDQYDRMTVAVRLGGLGPYRFLVDTGADRTAISKSLATRLKLVSAGKANLHSVTGVDAVETAIVPSLQFARKEIRVRGAPLLNEAHMGADGILGVDSLRSQRVQFDFTAGTMTIVPSIERDHIAAANDVIVVRARERNGRLVVTRAHAENQLVSVVLDTGSELSVGNEALRDRILRRDRRALERIGTIEVYSVTGEKLVGEYMILRKLEIGGVTISNLAIVFADAHTFRRLDLHRRPAMLLGMNAMRAFNKVSIDFANKKLRLLLPKHGSLDGARFASR